MDTHGVAHVKLVISQHGERLLKDGSEHRFRRWRAKAEMRARTPAEVTYARPANVESIRVGKRPFVAIGGAVEENHPGLSGNRYAGNRNFGGQVPRETLSRSVPAHAFFDRGIDQSPVLAQRLTLLWMQPEGIHEIREEVIDGSAAGEEDCHHVRDNLFLGKVRALLSSGNQH